MNAKGPSSKIQGIIAAGASLIVLAVLGWQVMESRHSDLLDKETWKAPDYSFQERSGRMFSSTELKGKVYVVDFIFGHCAGSCPLLSRRFQVIEQEWKDYPDLKLVTMTVDPEHDTAAFLKGYAADYHADANQWFFLTGQKVELYKVIRDGYKAAALEAPEQGPGFDFIHSTHLILVDGRGMVRGVYDGEQDDEVQKLHKDIKFLMSSKSHS
jgi:cytochrome oxidase Cu insertion factor (SCO1/SenC/PrrC family)